MNTKTGKKDGVNEFYSKIAKKGYTCSCFSAKVAGDVGYTKSDIKSVPDGSNLGLGCGNPVAISDIREGETVLDLGSGAGIDVFLASKKVGSSGKVIGIDMSRDMVKKANDGMKKSGTSNVKFMLGEIEKLPIAGNSVDVIISNCVINLSTDKDAVFSEAFRVLRSGGRLFVSDMMTKGKLPDEIRKDKKLWCSCVSGAIEKRNYIEKMKKVGFVEVDIISEKPYNKYANVDVEGKLESVSIRARKQ